jgi:hypothetical protein
MPIAIFRAGLQRGSLVVVPSNYNYVATENTLYVSIQLEIYSLSWEQLGNNSSIFTE